MNPGPRVTVYCASSESIPVSSHALAADPGGRLVRGGFYSKPIVILNHLGYWDSLLALFDRAYREGFVPASGRELYRVALTAAEAMESLR